MIDTMIGVLIGVIVTLVYGWAHPDGWMKFTDEGIPVVKIIRLPKKGGIVRIKVTDEIVDPPDITK